MQGRLAKRFCHAKEQQKEQRDELAPPVKGQREISSRCPHSTTPKGSTAPVNVRGASWVLRERSTRSPACVARIGASSASRMAARRRRGGCQWNWGRFRSLVRAFKTAAQTAVALIGTGAVGFTDLDWVRIASVSGVAALVSLLTSLAGIPRYPTASRRFRRRNRHTAPLQRGLFLCPFIDAPLAIGQTATENIQAISQVAEKRVYCRTYGIYSRSSGTYRT